MAETRLNPLSADPEFVVPDIFLGEDYRDIIEEFLDEFRDRNDRIRGALETIRRGDDPEVIRGLLKDVHSLKGTGGSMGYTIVTSICHVFEELLIKAFRDRLPCDRPRVLETADLFAGTLIAIAGEAAAGTRDFNGFVPAANRAIAAAREALGMAPRTAGNDRSATGAPATPKRVLLAEGTTFFRRVVEAALAPWPHISIDGTARAGEALDRAASGRHDLAIISRDLDGVSGLSLLAALRAEPPLDALPVILIEPCDADPLPAGSPAPDLRVAKDREFAHRLREAVATILDERVPA
ncbi:MAG: Hpt domain-containing protein [Planctomycetes bacterium]|nr:Hpt domain-containing protein [Planctomycetota bacterium]